MSAARLSALVLAVLTLSACATTDAPIGAAFRINPHRAAILIMPPDVEVSYVTTGGAELRADWSEQARANLLDALLRELSGGGERVTLRSESDLQAEGARQTLLLNQAVTDALAAHVVAMHGSTFLGPLPHQRSQREIYTLGRSARDLAPEAEADYALFLTARTQIESSGLVVANLLVSTVAGYTPVSHNFRGVYASLVDLRSGEVVWLRGHDQGDPRDAREATSIIEAIFEESPLAQRAPR